VIDMNVQNALKRLKIKEEQVIMALELMNEFHRRIIKMRIDPRASRIAILLAMRVDTAFASKSNFKELKMLEEIAEEFYRRQINLKT